MINPESFYKISKRGAELVNFKEILAKWYPSDLLQSQTCLQMYAVLMAVSHSRFRKTHYLALINDCINSIVDGTSIHKRLYYNQLACDD